VTFWKKDIGKRSSSEMLIKLALIWSFAKKKAGFDFTKLCDQRDREGA